MGKMKIRLAFFALPAIFCLSCQSKDDNWEKVKKSSS